MFNWSNVQDKQDRRVTCKGNQNPIQTIGKLGPLRKEEYRGELPHLIHQSQQGPSGESFFFQTGLPAS